MELTELRWTRRIRTIRWTHQFWATIHSNSKGQRRRSMRFKTTCGTGHPCRQIINKRPSITTSATTAFIKMGSSISHNRLLTRRFTDQRNQLQTKEWVWSTLLFKITVFKMPTTRSRICFRSTVWTWRFRATLRTTSLLRRTRFSRMLISLTCTSEW